MMPYAVSGWFSEHDTGYVIDIIEKKIGLPTSNVRGAALEQNIGEQPSVLTAERADAAAQQMLISCHHRRRLR